MKKFWAYFNGILADHEGYPSSKRWIALITFVMICITWGADLFYKMTSTEYIFNALVFLIIGCLGISGVEKFAPKSQQ